jgi:hypothetical protein
VILPGVHEIGCSYWAGVGRNNQISQGLPMAIKIWQDVVLIPLTLECGFAEMVAQERNTLMLTIV